MVCLLAKCDSSACCRPTLDRQLVEATGTVADKVCRRVHAIKHRHEQVVQWRFVVEADVATSIDSAAAATCEQDR